MVDLSPHARVGFAVLWVLTQAALIVTASRRSDHIFGFRMFPEASTLQIEVSRVTAQGTIPAPAGEWAARDREGQLRHFSWHDRIHDPILRSLDTRVFASYGVDTQLARLQVALDDVASHLDGDDETRWLRADVRVWKNGRDPYTTALFSHPRVSR